MDVDWNSKTARLTFDPSRISAQELAGVMSRTAHMMGRNMRYRGWLALTVSDLRDEATGEKVEQALGQVEGVARVATYPERRAAAVLFTGRGETSVQDLIAALEAAGLAARPYSSKGTSER